MNGAIHSLPHEFFGRGVYLGTGTILDLHCCVLVTSHEYMLEFIGFYYWISVCTGVSNIFYLP
jgi:hypothetical protein